MPGSSWVIRFRWVVECNVDLLALRSDVEPNKTSENLLQQSRLYRLETMDGPSTDSLVSPGHAASQTESKSPA